MVEALPEHPDGNGSHSSDARLPFVQRVLRLIGLQECQDADEGMEQIRDVVQSGQYTP